MVDPKESCNPDGPAAEPLDCTPQFSVPNLRVLRKIGEGSYGQVWLAQGLTGTCHAVKVVWRRSQDAGRAFDREYQGILNYEPVSRLHPSLVPVLHVGRDEVRGCFYYMMELADDVGPDALGEGAAGPETTPANVSLPARASRMPVGDPSRYVPHTLKWELERRGRLPFDRCVELGLALTAALEQLHGHGLTHRDIKPSNIIFARGVPKLTDIGLVARSDATRSWVGTVGYLPPEGAGSPVADLYSLGRVLYMGSTGRAVEHFPEPATGVDPGEAEAWAELNEIVLKACAEQADRRYQSAHQMRQDLLHLQAGGSIRRLRQTERQLALLRRFSVAAVLTLALVGLGWFSQARSARRLAEMARQNQAQLHQTYVANGIRAMDQSDAMTALVWLAEALALTPEGSSEAVAERRRWEAVRRLSPQLLRLGAHGGPINTAEASPDGRWIVSASEDRQACLWELETGRKVWRFPHDQPVVHACFSPDSGRIATACEDGWVRVWEVASGQLGLPPLRHEGKVIRAVFSPEGRWLLTCGANGLARLWDSRTGTPATPPLRHGGEVNDAEFSPDGAWLVTASDDSTAQIWEVATGHPVGNPMRHADHVRQARFSPDGRRVVTASRDRTARVWLAPGGQPLTPWVRHEVQLRFAAFSHDGRRVLSGGGGSENRGEVRLWDASSGELTCPPLRAEERILAGVWSPDDRSVATASHDQTARLWDAASGDPASPRLRHNHSVRTVGFLSDGHRLLTASRDGAWRLWETRTEAEADPLWHQASGIGGPCFAPGGRWVVIVGYPSGVVLWAPESGEHHSLELPGLGPAVHATFVQNGHRVAVVYDSGKVMLQDPFGHSPPQPLSDCTNAARCIVVSPDTNLLLVSSRDNAARLWHTDTGRPAGPPMPHSEPVQCAAFSPNGRWVATGCGADDALSGGALRLWSVPEGNPAGPPLPEEGVPNPVVFSPDGRWMIAGCRDASARPHAVRLREVPSGRPVGPPLSHSDGVGFVTFSPDGLRVATASEDGLARVWDPRTGRAFTSWFRHRRGIATVCFSSDGGRLVTASGDGTARVWDSFSGEALSPALRHSGNVNSAEFGPDGQSVLTAGSDGICRLWRFPAASQRVADLVSWASFQAGVRYDPTAGLTPFTAQELVSLQERLRAETLRVGGGVRRP